MLGSEKLQSLAIRRRESDGADFQFFVPSRLPKDETGNGGGFVFDARSLPNPGREERFKALTGKDAPVIDYLNQQESVHQFLASVLSLVDASVSRVSAPRLQEPDGVVRLHRRPASLGLPGRATGEAPARRKMEWKWCCGIVELEKIRPMKAMILAAGLGTRLRPLTDDRPKALVEIAGRTLLEITLVAPAQLWRIREVIVNVHHFADMVVDYLKANDNFGMRIEVSREEELLDTGGGLKKAALVFSRRESPG